jgi:hypothetical protein
LDKTKFHVEFQKLIDAFPASRVGPTVEATWYDALVRFGPFKIKAAFQLLTEGERFPNLGQAKAACRESHARGIVYVVPGESGCLTPFFNDPYYGPPSETMACAHCNARVWAAHLENRKKVYGQSAATPVPTSNENGNPGPPDGWESAGKWHKT